MAGGFDLRSCLQNLGSRAGAGKDNLKTAASDSDTSAPSPYQEMVDFGRVVCPKGPGNNSEKGRA